LTTYISPNRILQEYKILHYDNKVGLHHANCSERNTLIFEWPENFPGGMSLETVHDQIELHEQDIHRRFIDG